MDCPQPTGGDFTIEYHSEPLADQPQMMLDHILSSLHRAFTIQQTEHPDYIFTGLHQHLGEGHAGSNLIHLTFDRPARDEHSSFPIPSFEA